MFSFLERKIRVSVRITEIMIFFNLLVLHALFLKCLQSTSLIRFYNHNLSRNWVSINIESSKTGKLFKAFLKNTHYTGSDEQINHSSFFCQYFTQFTIKKLRAYVQFNAQNSMRFLKYFGSYLE